jgi:redox-sensitive bicupin YhaK (pirin superfamily)
MKIIKYNEKNRWKVDIWWLQSAHSFSFGQFFDPNLMWFWKLRVINDDIIAEWKWFWMHPHNNMEIITIVTKWSIKHEDSMWNSGIINQWEVQAMSAGSWILHSEYNPSSDSKTELFQIWIETKHNNIAPQYNQHKFLEYNENNIQLLVSPNNLDNAVYINQNAYISRGTINKEWVIQYKKYIHENWIYVLNIKWSINIDNNILNKRDAIWIIDWDNIVIEWISDNSELLIIEVPM